MMEVVDGQYQKYVVSGGDYIREDFFGKYPELLEMVKNYSDEKLQKLRAAATIRRRSTPRTRRPSSARASRR